MVFFKGRNQGSCPEQERDKPIGISLSVQWLWHLSLSVCASLIQWKCLDACSSCRAARHRMACQALDTSRPVGYTGASLLLCGMLYLAHQLACCSSLRFHLWGCAASFRNAGLEMEKKWGQMPGGEVGSGIFSGRKRSCGICLQGRILDRGAVYSIPVKWLLGYSAIVAAAITQMALNDAEFCVLATSGLSGGSSGQPSHQLIGRRQKFSW